MNLYKPQKPSNIDAKIKFKKSTSKKYLYEMILTQLGI
jgi:hypothetical protein